MKSKFKDQPGVFLGHTDCPECGSRDNRAIYDNGDKKTFYCFGCLDSGIVEGEIKKKEYTNEGEEFFNMKESVQEVNDYPEKGFRERKIKTAVSNIYGVKSGYSEDGKTIEFHYYPVTNKGKVVGYERREVSNKKFIAIGSVKNSDELFGQSKFASGGRKIIVTEGALDAMSVQQMYNDKDKEWPVVSVINGAGNAYKQVSANLEYLNSFNEVVFMFDADSHGEEAAVRCAKIIRTGKAKIATLGRYGKDANDYIVNGKGYELERAVWDAEAYSPAGIVNSADTWDLFNEDKRDDSIPYPECFGNVNKMTYGRRTGELTIFTAGTGSGKSSFVREDIYHVIQTTDIKIGIVSLEESLRDTLDGLVGLHLNKRISLPDTPFDRAGDEGKDAWEAVAGGGRMTLLDHQGSVSDNSLMDKIEFMAASGCKFIYLDHITLAVSEVEGNTNEAMDKLMSDLLKMCKKHDVWIGVVSHLRKTGGQGKTYEGGLAITEDALKGSGSLKQIAFQIIGFSRDKYADEEFDRNKVKISVLKDRFTGHTGSAGNARFDDDTGRYLVIPEEFS